MKKVFQFLALIVTIGCGIFPASAEDAQPSNVVELGKDDSIVISETPQNLTEAYGIMGGSLTITGPDTEVVQNIPASNTTSDGMNFLNYWPWGEGTVIVENGATLKSNTELFWGGASADKRYANNVRKLVVQSGAEAIFTPESREVCICSPWADKFHNAWVVVTGSGSKLLLPDKVYLSNKNRSPEGHPGTLEILDKAYAEMGTLYAGHCAGTLRLVVSNATLKATGGIYCYKNNNRWTGGTFVFRDCLVETPLFKFSYPATAHCGDKVTFNGAVFRPVGVPADKFIDGPPTIAEMNAKFFVEGPGLIIDAPESALLEVTPLLQGSGGFVKRGNGTVILSAQNEYTGSTVVESGVLKVTGSISRDLSVEAGYVSFDNPVVLDRLSIASGGAVSVVGVGSKVGEVSDFSGSFNILLPENTSWPLNTPVVSSSTVEFLEKVALSLNENVAVDDGLVFAVKEGSVQLVEEGIVNGTLTWVGGTGDLWSTAENWDGAERRIYSGDSLVVSAAGQSVNDLGDLFLKSVVFTENLAPHSIKASSGNDSVLLQMSVVNASHSLQTFDLPISVTADEFSVNATGEVAFAQGLTSTSLAGTKVIKEGPGVLSVSGATWAGDLDLREGSVILTEQTQGAAVLSGEKGALRINGHINAGGASLTLADDDGRVLRDNAVLENGEFTYIPRAGYNYLALGDEQVLLLTNKASLTTSSSIFENGTGNGRGIRILDNSSLIFNNIGNGFISSKDDGRNFIYVSHGLTLILPKGRTYIAWPQWAGRTGRLDVSDGSYVEGGSIEFGWRASESWFTLTNSVASFTDGFYLDVDGNIDYSHSHMHVTDSIVTSAVWRVGNSLGKVHKSTELVFDNAKLVPSKADSAESPFFLCTKADCNQIRILAGGLAIEALYDVNVNAPFAGEGGFIKLGERTLTLSSTNAYTGATVVSAGTLRLKGRVAGPIEVRKDAVLELSIPDQDAVPCVPSFTVESGASLAAIDPGLPDGARYVKVLESDTPVTLPDLSLDEYGNRFFVKQSSSGGSVLCYGRKPGFSIIVR